MSVILSHHARERCVEMRVPTKRVKHGVAHPDLRYPSNVKRGAWVSVSGDLAIAHRTVGGHELVITVLWHGKTGRPIEGRSKLT